MFKRYADYLLPGKQALYLCVNHSFDFNRFASMWCQNRILFNRLSTNLKRKRWLQLPSYHYMRTMYIRIKQHELASLSSCSIKKWFSQCCYFFGIFLEFRNIFRELVFYESPSPPHPLPLPLPHPLSIWRSKWFQTSLPCIFICFAFMIMAIKQKKYSANYITLNKSHSMVLSSVKIPFLQHIKLVFVQLQWEL